MPGTVEENLPGLGRVAVNPRRYLAFTGVVVFVMIAAILWVAWPSLSTRGSNINATLSEDETKAIKSSAESFLKTSGKFGVLETVVLEPNTLVSTLETISNGDEVLSRQDVYESLKLGRWSALYRSEGYDSSMDLNSLSSFSISDISVGKVTAKVEKGIRYAEVQVSYLSKETTRSTSVDPETQNLSVEIKESSYSVTGSVVFTDRGEDGWGIYDVNVNYPFTLATWEFSSDFVDLRLDGETVEIIVSSENTEE